MDELTDDRLRNTMAWAEARIGSLSGADVIYGAIRELLEYRNTRAAPKAEPVADAEDAADREAGLLLDALMTRYGVPDGWEPLPDAAGKITQISNILAAPPARDADYEATVERFAEWLAREVPPGTVISDPKWWAPRIARAFVRASIEAARQERGT